MNRRDFLKLGTVTMYSSAFIGCGKENSSNRNYKKVKMPAFSEFRLHAQLDKLLTAYESKGMQMDGSLLPPLSETEIRKQCSWFPGELPREIIALYTWRGGQEKDAWESKYPFWFRDNSFCSLERARSEYMSMMRSYGMYPGDHEMLKYSFPIASFNGSWYVLPTRTHNFPPFLEKPIISVFEGIDVYFYTIESMVNTCLDWVSHPLYDENYTLPGEIEMEIWRKHNPGIFDYNV